MILFNKDSSIKSASRRFCTIYKSENPVPCQPSGRRDIPSERPIVQSTIRPDDRVSIASSVRTTRTFCPDLPLCQEASNCSSLHPFGCFSSPSGRHSVFDQASGFLFKTQIWEDRCNRPDDVDSRPDTFIHKASIAFKIQTSGYQSSWSERSSIRYGNCVHQINRPDDHPPGPDTRSLYMEITCSRRATVRTTGQHRPNTAQKQERFSAKFLKFWSHSCPSGRHPILSSPTFI
jgi:hypothetical protein